MFVVFLLIMLKQKVHPRGPTGTVFSALIIFPALEQFFSLALRTGHNMLFLYLQNKLYFPTHPYRLLVTFIS